VQDLHGFDEEGKMEQVTLWDALRVTEKLSPADQLRLIHLLSGRLCDKELDSELIDMLSLAGKGADLWRQIDIADYLEQERSSWES
jgi:hypothetical protein